MAAFSFKALENSGRLRKGVIEGESARNVRNQLRAQGLKPVEVKPAVVKREDGLRWQIFKSYLTPTELTLFSRQLSTLIQAGMPLDDALIAVAQQSSKARAKGLVLQLRTRVREGFPLASALADYPKVFNDMYRAMVSAGEQAGFLGAVLEQLADYGEERQYTQQKLKMAMVYPIILVFVAVVVISLLMIFVVPELVGLFRHTDTELPVLTKLLIQCSDFLSTYWIYCLVLSVGVIVGLKLLFKRPSVLSRWHSVLLRLPLVADFVTAVESARFASTLSILVTSGVPLLDGLRIAGQVLGNRTLRDASAEVAKAVQEGASLHRALAQSNRFPPIMVHMVASGEQSGQLEVMLSRSSQNQERELEMKLGTLTSLFEPLMVLVMAVIVGAIVMAVLLPIIQMNDLVA
ncbi:type II secretion system protein GspF [Motiliproteus coralliicola]|uniref:General secretion pathway protein F n=1 Tax=Motiliproteus coralliicola TaxID=2283196 RepID=A0A369WMC4_9GAMM|nr:type II secretion system inner membrane protein GspF [Motiliproteus coralliicola]RDE22363.1 type II secretion system protein GspF [Motiliproteus coralliicola]